MSFLFRSACAVRSVASATISRPAAIPAKAFRLAPSSSFQTLRFASTTPSSAASSSTSPSTSASSDAAPEETQTQETLRRYRLPDAAHLLPQDITLNAENPDAWWRANKLTVNNQTFPGNQYTGRSSSRDKYLQAYSRVRFILRESDVRGRSRRAEFYEKPSLKRVRLKSERHRRRFQEQIRQRVHQVQMLRARK